MTLDVLNVRGFQYFGHPQAAIDSFQIVGSEQSFPGGFVCEGLARVSHGLSDFVRKPGRNGLKRHCVVMTPLSWP